MQMWKRHGLAKAFMVVVMVCGFCGVAQAQDMEQKQYRETLRQLCQSDAMDVWRGQMPMQTRAEIEQYLQQFEAWSVLAGTAQNYAWVETEYVDVTAFKDKIRAVQAEAFPKLRAALGGALTQELKGVSVKAGGDGFRNLRLTGKNFEDMALVKEMHTGLATLLLELRFAQVEFMLDHEDVTANFRLMGITDDVIVLWDANYQQYGIIN